MNEIAKVAWDNSVALLNQALESDDINEQIAKTSMSEISLKQAKFALAHPELVMGLDQIPMPDGNTPVPQGPIGGPRLWGTAQ